MGNLIPAIVLALAVSSTIIPTVMVLHVLRWRRLEEARIEECRAKHVRELEEAKEKARQEERRWYIAWNDLGRDSDALVLACQELSVVWDDETDDLAYDADWRKVRERLRGLAYKHTKEYADEQMKKSYVPIREEE